MKVGDVNDLKKKKQGHCGDDKKELNDTFNNLVWLLSRN